MPNNLVFNNVADQLKSLVHGHTSTGLAIPLNVDTSGNVSMTVTDLDIRSLTAATDTVSIGNTVTVEATDLDIRPLTGATDSVTVTATDFDIRPLTAATDTVSIGNTVTVEATDLDIRDLSAATDTISLGGRQFTESNITVGSFVGTGVVLQFDTSQQQEYSYYVKNTGSAVISVKLQISPTDNADYFVDDGSGEVSVAAGDKAVLVLQKYLRYTRVYYNSGAATATAEFYYNARV
jgi:hypothetical protein